MDYLWALLFSLTSNYLLFWAGPTRVVKVVDSSRSSILSKKHTCRVFMHLLSSGWYLMINNWKNNILDTFFNENRLTWSPLSDFWCGFCELLGQTGLLERKLHTTLGLFRAKMHQIAWFFNVFKLNFLGDRKIWSLGQNCQKEMSATSDSLLDMK